MPQKIISHFPMKLLRNRVRSFEGRHHLFTVEIKDLAAAGLYYTGKRDRAKCAFCGIEMEDWSHNDMALLDHRRLSSNCYFIQKKYEEYSKEKYYQF